MTDLFKIELAALIGVALGALMIFLSPWYFFASILITLGAGAMVYVTYMDEAYENNHWSIWWAGFTLLGLIGMIVAR